MFVDNKLKKVGIWKITKCREINVHFSWFLVIPYVLRTYILETNIIRDTLHSSYSVSDNWDPTGIYIETIQSFMTDLATYPDIEIFHSFQSLKPFFNCTTDNFLLFQTASSRSR